MLKSIKNAKDRLPPITLYTLDNLQELSDNDPNEIDYLKSLMKNGVPYYIENISGEINILKIGNQLLPILITSGNVHDSYVCSPYGHYVSLGQESLPRIKNKWMKRVAESGLKGLACIIKKAAINPAIYINHSLFSTDLQPNHLPQSHISSIVHFFKKKFPTHTLIFRSINAKSCPDLKTRLKSCGFQLIATRQVFLTDMEKAGLFNTRIIKSDLKLWNEKNYEVISQDELSEADEQHILRLYHLLSINSHSALNPKLSMHCLKWLKSHPTFQLKALKINGVIEGAVGYHIKENLFHCSFFGYDKLSENNTLIYRLLSTLLLLEAAKNGKVFHQSAGASFYKTIRRAKKTQEYQAIYTKHLLLKQKLAWFVLKTVINTFAVPFMKKY